MYASAYALKLLPGLDIRYMEALPLTSRNNMYAYIQNGMISCISHEAMEIPESEIIEYDDQIVNPIYRDGEIIEYIDEEVERKARVKQSLISTPDISSVDLEGVSFSDIEIGDIIQARVFNGNPHAESALQAKTSAYLLSVVSGDPNTQLLEEINLKREQINEIRTKFNLNTI